MNKLQQAMAFIEADKWDAAHEIAQSGQNKYYYLVHGLLHRIEGDMSNARYWYSKANEAVIDNTLTDEINRIKVLLNSQS